MTPGAVLTYNAVAVRPGEHIVGYTCNFRQTPDDVSSRSQLMKDVVYVVYL